MAEIVANPDAGCICPLEEWPDTDVIPQQRPLATFLFCFTCGGTRVRIQRVAFKLHTLKKHLIVVGPS